MSIIQVQPTINRYTSKMQQPQGVSLEQECAKASAVWGAAEGAFYIIDIITTVLKPLK